LCLEIKVISRSKNGINHGVVLIPEGLIEFIPEFKKLIGELNDFLSSGKKTGNLSDELTNSLTDDSRALFESLSELIRYGLIFERDAHGNVQVSKIKTEELLIDRVSKKIAETDKSINFSSNSHFFGYEGRCGAPSKFDADFAYNLGLTAGALILDGKTGYMAAITRFETGAKPVAIPITELMKMERRQGKEVLVIEKALVDLNSKAFKYFASRRDDWAKEDLFSSPGPRQYWGPTANQLPITVALNQGYESLNYQIGD